MLRILETITDPGDPGKANEDALGHVQGQAGDHLWVIDGATDVADGSLIGNETGAHWLAQRASALFAEKAAGHGSDLRGLLKETIEVLARDFERERLRAPNGRHEWPSAAMMLLHAGQGCIDAANFADCGLVHLEDGMRHLVRRPLKGWADRLDEKVFVRVSRDALVNLHHVLRQERDEDAHGQVWVTGRKYPVHVSRRSWPLVRARLQRD